MHYTTCVTVIGGDLIPKYHDNAEIHGKSYSPIDTHGPRLLLMNYTSIIDKADNTSYYLLRYVVLRIVEREHLAFQKRTLAIFHRPFIDCLWRAADEGGTVTSVC